MSRIIDLVREPSQEFTVVLEGNRYDITIKELSGTMGATISRDEEILITNVKMAAEVPLLPYSYLENGNFIMLTQNEEIPFYTSFNTTQFLYFASQSELEAIRGES